MQGGRPDSFRDVGYAHQLNLLGRDKCMCMCTKWSMALVCYREDEHRTCRIVLFSPCAFFLFSPLHASIEVIIHMSLLSCFSLAVNRLPYPVLVKYSAATAVQRIVHPLPAVCVRPSFRLEVPHWPLTWP